MDYPTYVTTMAGLIVTQPTDTNFSAMLPTMITNAELRLCRDFDFLATTFTDASATTQLTTQSVDLPEELIVIRNLNIIDAAGSRWPMTPIGRAYIDMVYNDPTMPGLPVYYAMVTQTQIWVGPIPDQNYSVEVIGTQRPATLSSGNPTTFISVEMQDLFIAASMIYAAGWMKNYGSQADDPKMAMSWDQQYQELMKGALVEELRKKHQSQAWSSQFPTPTTPAQG